jgi:serine/threonine protein kinase
MEDLVGSTLGRFEITALVGRGGMATVYKARHPGLEQTVAIKVLHPHFAADPDMTDRFRHEARAVAALRHPNIVRVVDFDKSTTATSWSWSTSTARRWLPISRPWPPRAAR